MIAFAVVAGYLLCSFLAWGFTMGSFTKEFPYFDQKGVAIFTAFFGPVGLFVSLILGNRSWRVKPMSRAERWDAFHTEWPSLSYEYFLSE